MAKTPVFVSGQRHRDALAFEVLVRGVYVHIVGPLLIRAIALADSAARGLGTFEWAFAIANQWRSGQPAWQ